MNRAAAAALGALAGALVGAGSVAVALRSRGEPRPEAGRYQLHSARRLLLLDTGTGELWSWRQGAWQRAARPPGAREAGPASEEPVFWEDVSGPPGAEPPPEPPPPPAPAASEDRGRAETIQVLPEQAPPRR